MHQIEKNILFVIKKFELVLFNLIQRSIALEWLNHLNLNDQSRREHELEEDRPFYGVSLCNFIIRLHLCVFIYTGDLIH